jgi:multidrug efflux pump subunit AcrA (membrane-fusion protein)
MTASRVKTEEFSSAVDDIQKYLAQKAHDDYAANVYGTLIQKAASRGVRKEALEPLWKYLDQYNDALAQHEAQQNPDRAGKLKWGVDWMPAEDVKRYREVRVAGSMSVTQAAQQLESARARLRQAQAAFERAKRGEAADRVGAEGAVQTAAADVATAEKNVQAAAMTMPPPKWLEKFEPAPPDSNRAMAP